MERSGVPLVTLACVLFSRISGAEVELRVRPGDDATLYCDRSWTKMNRVWIRNSSNKHQPPLIITEEDLRNGTFPRYSFLWNPSIRTHDLLVRNVTESDMGLYSCGGHEKSAFKRKAGAQVVLTDVYYYGHRITRLSLFGMDVSCADLQTPSTPPVSDCRVCWKLLVSVCPVCFLLSSTCLYCICRHTTKVEKEDNQGESETKQSRKSGKRDEAGGVDVCYSSLDLPSRGQKRPEQRYESSDFSTYSEVKTAKM
ncbi:hypothetical protein AOLI_G00198680 [Acnodon oligacanthus]